ncbi:MAG: pantetheine-phosphate adenylyltransferase [Clostridiales Family XIII bacterium]|nr:pantetheine-phosphate adenylyltransferase [Clostridiales Family XIII bacterium]
MSCNKMLYAGTFDPITNGHLDVIKRASSLSDELVIGVLENNEKTPLFSVEERIDMIGQITSGMANVKVISFSGLLAHYVNENGITAVVRGLRAAMDFDYEIKMAQLNARLYKGNVETIFLMTDPANSFISSSLIKEVFRLGGDIKGFVPDVVAEFMDMKGRV